MGDAISDLREVPVGALFVTRTDERGIIQAYNTVFQQFTGFSPEDLHHAPHKIIRNSDMCAIENSQLGPTQQSSVQTIIQELRRFQNSTETNIIEIRSCLDKIYRDIDVVRRKNRGSGYGLESPRSAA